MVIITEDLESSSSYKYDVFLSFRGVDTRLSFTNHLHKALEDANLTTFLDDEEILTGEFLKPELKSAIRASRASIIVLSENYASSTWCLEELVLILDRNRTSDHIVIPIFYHVEPTDVRKQKNSFGDAMAKHKQRMEEETDAEKKGQFAQKMEMWKKALTEIANLKGADAEGRLETEFIEEIVKDIYQRLGVPLRTTLPLLIGVDYNIKIITSWLKDGSSHTADILTISGMGGIGKTSLANYVYELHRREYTSCSFVENISRRCAQQNGLRDVQKQLCDGILKRISTQLHSVSEYTSMIEKAVAHKKVLLVLDDVDNLVQLDVLLGNKGFHPGSKIIITTKDTSLTKRCALFNPLDKPKHTEVLLRGLYKTESLELLCIHAFKSEKPKEGYKEVSEKLVKYCEGHPLALEVLGRSLHNQDVVHWEACIESLQKEPHSHIKKALQMSFDSLPFENDKDLFKHIACFFVGKDRYMTETILNACDINTRSGITNLVDRCLLSIGWNKKLMMHQLVQEMGRDLVRQESPDKPWERSLLWCHEESFKVLEQKKGTENLLGLALDMRMLEKEKFSGSLQLKTDALSKMDNLKLLQLNYVKINGSYKDISKELRWLCMHGFHFKSVPSELPMENLVALDMSHSKIVSFDMSYSYSQRVVSRLKGLIGSSSKDKRVLGSLKILDLSFCEQLRSLGGFFQLPALERLIVKNCISLIEVCESIEQCVELVLIDMSSCYKLNKLQISLSKLNKVKTLLLDGRNLGESRIEIWDMDSSEISINIQASSSAIMEAIPRDVAIYLPRSLVSLSLQDNNLSNESFPMDLSSLSMLKELRLGGNPVVSMPICVRTLPRLETLSMSGCNMLMSIEHPPPTLRKLVLYSYTRKRYLPSLRKIAFVPEMSPLKIYMGYKLFARSSFEIEGIVKVQLMASVEDNLLRSLGWTNLDFIIKRRVGTSGWSRQSEEFQIQMYYQFGIFSTFYGGKEMPNWIRRRSKGPSISFTIPSSPKKLRGLNFCCCEQSGSNKDWFYLPCIRISNITKNRTWRYWHYIHTKVKVGGKRLTMLSHWMFGMNEMEAGDEITITVIHQAWRFDQITMKCGVSVVYDDGKMEEEEDALGYYKSWNHIIGGDLFAFQTTTGEYMLYKEQFFLTGQEDGMAFKAFSERK